MSFKNSNSQSNQNKRGSGLESLLHSEHTVTIEKMSVGGDGVARIPVLDRTVVVFIPKSAPQDEVKIKITQTEKTFLYGSILEIIKPSPFRREPPCPVAMDCGGCSWQQITEDEQVRQKELLLKELFKKFLPQVSYELSETIQTEHKFEYRNRIQLKHINNQLGYFKPNSHDIVPINDCPISEKPIRGKIAELNKTLKPAAKLKKYELYINQNEEVVTKDIGDHGEGLAFSQVNRFINELMVNHTVKAITDLKPNFVSELYSGSGNFTFALASELQKINPQFLIETVELNSELTRFAAETIKKNKWIKNVLSFTNKAEVFSKTRTLSSEVVLLDPPRSGCHEDVMASLGSKAPQHIVYISCHPTSLVRDLGLLLKKAPYRVRELRIFDMFPQTDHFETYCFLERE